MSGRVVLITGAAGGLGRELITEFVAQKWQVVAGMHESPIKETDPGIWPVALDVTNKVNVTRAVARLLNRFGRIDVLINNAGVTGDELSFQMQDEVWDRVLDINLKGAFLCSQAVARQMGKQRDGHIINIGSFSGRSGQIGQANYSAAKAGLIGLTNATARELGFRNVRVNLVLPGVLATQLSAAAGDTRLGELASANVLGRINDIGEVARFIVFLSSMRNVSGQIFQLDSRISRWT